MKISYALLALTALLYSSTSMAEVTTLDEGKQLYKTYCSACHGATGGMDMSKRLAPPIAGVRFHYIDVHPEKAAFIKAISDWLTNQDASRSLMQGAIRKFGIMPSVPVSKKDAEKIAVYMYEGKLEKLPGFDEHFEKMHGKRKR